MTAHSEKETAGITDLPASHFRNLIDALIQRGLYRPDMTLREVYQLTHGGTE